MKTDKLPLGWRWAKLSNVCDDIYRYPSFYGMEHIKFGVPVIRGEHIQDGGEISTDWDDYWFISQEDSEKFPRTILTIGDLVFTVRGTIGKTGIIRESHHNAQVSPNLIRISPKRSVIDSTYLWYYFQNVRNSDEAVRDNAVTIATVKASDLSNLRIPIPPLNEQRWIATRLNGQLAAVESARKAAEEQLHAARQLPSAYLREEFDREDIRNAPNKPFGELVNNFDGKRIPVKSDDRKKRQGQYPYYGASGIIDTIDEYLFDGEFLLVGEDGANLLFRSTPIAFRATGKFWVNNHAHVVQPKSNVLLDYLLHFYAITDLKPYVTGAAQPKLTQDAMNSIPIPIPSMEIQERVVHDLNQHLSEVENMQKILESQLAEINSLPASLLREAFAGEM